MSTANRETACWDYSALNYIRTCTRTTTSEDVRPASSIAIQNKCTKIETETALFNLCFDTWIYEILRIVISGCCISSSAISCQSCTIPKDLTWTFIMSAWVEREGLHRDVWAFDFRAGRTSSKNVSFLMSHSATAFSKKSHPEKLLYINNVAGLVWQQRPLLARPL